MSRPAGPLGSYLRAQTSAGAHFAAGALAMAGFLFQSDLAIRGVELALFLLLSSLSGRRIRLLPYLLALSGIVAFNLVIPAGKVLVSVFGFPITLAALKAGLAKASAFTGMIALSRFSIRGDLRLPGRLGGLIARSLLYFERIMAERRRIDRRDIIGSIDRILLDVQTGGIDGQEVAPSDARSGGRTSPARQGRSGGRTTPAGALALLGFVGLTWAPLAAVLILGRAPVFGL